MPRVVVAVPAPVDPDASEPSGVYLDMAGRTATYLLREAICTSEGCGNRDLELRYDGVSGHVLRSTSNLIFSSKASDGVAAWQEVEPDGSVSQYAATADGVVSKLGDHAFLDDYDVSGSDVAWSSVDWDTFTFRVHLNGRDITGGIDAVGGILVRGDTVLFGANTTPFSLVAYGRDTGRYSRVPAPPPDFHRSGGYVLSEDGQQLIALLRRNGAGSVWIYDLRTRQTRTFALPGTPIYAIDTDGGRYLAWLIGFIGSGPHIGVTDLQTGASEDVDVTAPDSVGAYTGNVSDGQLSWDNDFGSVGIYDMAGHASTVVSDTGGGTEVANSGENVAWLGPNYTDTVTLTLSYPADQAVLAIGEALLRYRLPLAAEVRLGAPLALAVVQLRRGAYPSAGTALQDFSGAVARLQSSGTLDRQRAADLTAAAQRIVAVL